jgi:hypothetical protein
MGRSVRLTYVQQLPVVTTQIARDLGIFKALAAEPSKAFSTGELAKKNGADPLLLRENFQWTYPMWD